jgi:HlyD family secretion protein
MALFLLLIGSDFFSMYIPEKAVPVKVNRVTFREVTRSITAVGSIETAAKTVVNAPRGGKVIEVYFDELDYVREGDILARLDDTELTAQLEQAKAALAQARANLRAWEPILRRTQRLYAKGFVARQEWEKSQQQYELYKLAVQERRSLYQKAQAQLAKTVIRAPMSGTVTRKLVGIGTGIAEIADLQALEVHTSVDETDIGKIHMGQRTRITVDAYPEQQFEGVVKEIALTTLTERKDLGIQYAVRVSITPPPVPLRLGMTANVEFIITHKDRALSIPVWALLQRDGTNIAFVVANSRLHAQLVETGVKGEEFVEVVSGLQPGQLVVVGDLSKLKDGQLVKDEAAKLTLQ